MKFSLFSLFLKKDKTLTIIFHVCVSTKHMRTFSFGLNNVPISDNITILAYVVYLLIDDKRFHLRETLHFIIFWKGDHSFIIVIRFQLMKSFRRK